MRSLARLNTCRPMLLFACLLAIAIYSTQSFIFSYLQQEPDPILFYTKSPLHCEGKINATPEIKDWGVRADVKLESCEVGGAIKKVGGMARLAIKDEGAAELSSGERISFDAKFSRSREFKNEGSFSYRQWLLVHGIGAEGNVSGKIERLGDGHKAPFFERLRNKIGASAKTGASGEALGIILALASGDQGFVSRDLRDAFSSSGLAHLIAISGMNVAYVAALIYFIIRFFVGFFPRLMLYVPRRIAAALFTIPMLWCYVLITGSAISAVRAGIMLTVFLMGHIIYRRQDLLNTLAVACIIIMLVMPLSIFDVSFELSVMAVLGIILLIPRLDPRLRGDDKQGFTRKIFYWAKGLAAVTLAAGVITFPLVAYHFKFVSFIGLVANLIAVPATGALLSPVVAVASLVAIINPGLALYLWKISAVAADYFTRFTFFVARVGDFAVFNWAPNEFEVLLLYAIIALVFFWRRVPFRKIALIVIVVVTLSDIFYWRILPAFNNNLRITMMDVGQGDSILIQFPKGPAWLIDGGGIKGSTFDIGRYVLSPALWRMGVHSINKIVLTHPHYDHYYGLGFIARKFGPNAIITNGITASKDEEGEWENFLNDVKMAGVPAQVAENNSFNVNGVNVQLFRPEFKEGGDLNDSSIILFLRYGSKSFLFMGDTTAKGESKFIEMNGDTKADVLKIGHHGSRDASSEYFLQKVSPKIALISAGEHNRYNLPDAKALARIKETGAQIYRTDLNGAITITSDGNKMSVKTFIEVH